jgi:hypothetical protein
MDVVIEDSSRRSGAMKSRLCGRWDTCRVRSQERWGGGIEKWVLGMIAVAYCTIRQVGRSVEWEQKEWKGRARVLTMA